LDLLNEFEETITQSLQGMHSLITEIKNLKDKKEFEEKLLKKQDEKIKIKNKINNFAKDLYFDYSKEKSPKCLDISQKYENKFGKNKSFILNKELNLYKNIYEPENNINIIKSNGNKNQIYLNKNSNNSTININPSNEMKKLKNLNTIDNFNTNNTISDFHKNKICNNNNNEKKIISNNSMHEKDPLIYDLFFSKDLGKDQNQSIPSIPIINYNDFNNNSKFNKDQSEIEEEYNDFEDVSGNFDRKPSDIDKKSKSNISISGIMKNSSIKESIAGQKRNSEIEENIEKESISSNQYNDFETSNNLIKKGITGNTSSGNQAKTLSEGEIKEEINYDDDY
jgi:hypothetical protein